MSDTRAEQTQEIQDAWPGEWRFVEYWARDTWIRDLEVDYWRAVIDIRGGQFSGHIEFDDSPIPACFVRESDPYACARKLRRRAEVIVEAMREIRKMGGEDG